MTQKVQGAVPGQSLPKQRAKSLFLHADGKWIHPWAQHFTHQANRYTTFQTQILHSWCFLWWLLFWTIYFPIRYGGSLSCCSAVSCILGKPICISLFQPNKINIVTIMGLTAQYLLCKTIFSSSKNTDSGVRLAGWAVIHSPKANLFPSLNLAVSPSKVRGGWSRIQVANPRILPQNPSGSMWKMEALQIPGASMALGPF